MTLRQKIARHLDNIDTPIGRAVNLAIAALVLVSSAIFVAETYAIPDWLRFQLDLVNASILGLFLLEYLLRLWCAQRPLRYIFSLYALIDLVAILPSFIWFVDISFVRLLRWFRILRLVRLLDSKLLRDRIGTEDSIIIARILFTLFAIIFIFSGLIYQVEHAANPQGFRTFLDAVYFSVVTMTTVGFGDVTPISETGRLLTLLMIAAGIILLPLQIGDLIKRFVKTANKMEAPCPQCGLSFHDTDALFCKRCGTELRCRLQPKMLAPLDTEST